MRRVDAGSRKDGSRKGPGDRTARPGAAAEAAPEQRMPIGGPASAMVKATGELQQAMAGRAGLLQREAAHQLRMATNPAEVMAVQTALLMAGWQHSIQCTTDVANAWFAIGAAGALPKDRKPLN